MLGVATLIVVMAVMTGFRADLLDRILGVNGHATVRSYDVTFVDRDALVAQLQAADGVVLATPLLDGQAMLSSGDAVRGVLVRGLPLDKLQKLPSLDGNIIDGDLQALSGKNTIAIGARLAERYRFKIGDRVSLISPRGTQTPFGTAPRLQQFKLVAIFRVGLSEYDLNFTFTSINTAAKFFGFDSNQGAIDLIFDDADKVDAYTAPLRPLLGDAHYLIDWKQANSTLAGALEVERNVMFLILTMILLVAALNIISGLVMLVRDKGRDIAVLRSMGPVAAWSCGFSLLPVQALAWSAHWPGLGWAHCFAPILKRCANSSFGRRAPICFRQRSISSTACRHGFWPKTLRK